LRKGKLPWEPTEMVKPLKSLFDDPMDNLVARF
jgi:hypothetical protein